MTVLDLLSATGKLSMAGENSFEQAALLCGDSPDAAMHPSSLRRNLEGLGHARCNFKARKVEALASRFCILPWDGTGQLEAVLTGARSTVLREELEYLSSGKNVSMHPEVLGSDLPDRVSLKGAFDDLANIAGSARCASVSISSDPTIPDAWRILTNAPYLRDLIDGICSQPMGYENGTPGISASIYDPKTGFYSPWGSIRETYASNYLIWKKTPFDYRLAWKLEKGTWRKRLEPVGMDPFWGWWAARAGTGSSSALPAISVNGSFKVPKVCPLPGALHQACCLCSGYPPSLDDQFLIYPDVPPVIQHGVREKLAVNLD